MKNALVIVIGSGQGGVPLAVDLAKRGRHVMPYERDEIGGSCVNFGCTPSKSFLAAAHGPGRVLAYDQACKKGIRARCEEMPLSDVARAVEWGKERGFYRMVVDCDTEKIVGATLVGYEASELVRVFIAHMQSGSTWRTLDDSVHIHPTYSEAFPGLARLFESPKTTE